MSFTTLIDLRGTSQKRVWVWDNYNYLGALGWNINDVVAVLSVTGPQGSFYDNTNFDLPDIIHATSNKSIRIINIPLDPLTEYTEPLKGNYTVTITARNNSTLQTVNFQRTYLYDITPPVINADIKAGPYSGIFSSRDTTNYGAWASQVTREHRIKYPVELIPAIPDVVSSADYVEITPIYTGRWRVEITSYVLWTMQDTLQIEWEGMGRFDKCVHGECIKALAVSVNNLLNEYSQELPSQISNQEARQKRMVIINQAWHLLNIAYKEGDVQECDRLSDIIQKQIEFSIGGMCVITEFRLITPCPPYEGNLWETDGIDTIRPILNKKVNVIHLTGIIDGGTL